MTLDATPMLEVSGIRVEYPAPRGARTVVDGLSLQLSRGEIGCLLGGSGCGKTTVLRAIAGFEPVRAGRIVLADRTLSAPGQGVPPEQRRVGLMFQDHALFPHLDVASNIGFGLASRPRGEREARIGELLALVGLSDRARSYPHELSGGQQQRVALARALAPSPEVLLLDEPFSNLDADTRQRLAAETRDLLKATGTAVLMVTHDQAEAFAVADRVGVMEQGRILQWDTPEALFAAPRERAVAGFIGGGDWVPGEALGLGAVDVRLRPGDLLVDAAGPFEAEVVAVSFRGPGHVARVRLPGGALATVPAGDVPPCTGARLGLRLAGEPLRFPRG